MPSEMNKLQFEGFTLDLRRRELRRHDTVVPVPGKAFDLLAYMASNPGRPLAKVELLEAVWPGTNVEEANLSQNVFILRKVLGSGDSGPIKTLAGRGYQFAAHVAEVQTAHEPVSPQVVSTPVTTLTLEASQTRMVVRHDIEEHYTWLAWTKLAALVAVLLAVGVTGWFTWQHWLDRTGGAPIQIVLTQVDGTTGDAVLDLALTDALRIDLAQSPFVTVLSSSRVRTTLTQMKLAINAPVTSATAREICERTDSQVVLHGTIARMGQHFLLTETATSCVDGADLGQDKQQAAHTEDLPQSVDRLAENLRRTLGESRRSIARFGRPLFPQNTVSLEALKSFSQAVHDFEQGKLPEAIQMNDRAIAADPEFAAAYFNRSAYASTVGDDVSSRTAILKAYSLRDSVNEPLRLAISASYNIVITGNLFETERICHNWSALYPHSQNAWNFFSNTELSLGKIPEATAYAEIDLRNWPDNQENTSNYAILQMHNGDLAGSRSTFEKALSENRDGDPVRSYYLILAYLLHDEALLHAQRAWGEHHQASWSLVSEAWIANSEGRFSDAQKLTARAAAGFRQQGLASVADSMTRGEGVTLIEAGDPEDGKRLLHSSAIDPEGFADLVGLVDAGEVAEATSLLKRMETKYPQGTLLNLYWGPRIKAGIAMAAHKPKEAIALMEITHQFDRKDNLPMPKFRADADLAAGQPEVAEREYRAILAHPELDPTSTAIPLSWLQLGRALTAEGKRSDAVDAYRHFLALWAHADPDATYLKQGRLELERLQTQ